MSTSATAGIKAEALAAASEAAAKHYATLLEGQRIKYIADLQTKPVSMWWWDKRTFTKEEAELSWDRNLWAYDNEDHRRHAIRLLKLARTDDIFDIRLPADDIQFLRVWLNAPLDV